MLYETLLTDPLTKNSSRGKPYVPKNVTVPGLVVIIAPKSSHRSIGTIMLSIPRMYLNIENTH